jgi:hypothetical protein
MREHQPLPHPHSLSKGEQTHAYECGCRRRCGCWWERVDGGTGVCVCVGMGGCGCWSGCWSKCGCWSTGVCVGQGVGPRVCVVCCWSGSGSVLAAETVKDVREVEDRCA